MNYLSQALKSTPVLIILSVFFILVEFNAGTVFSLQLKQTFNVKEPLVLAYLALYTVACLLLAPLALSKFIFRENPQQLGLQYPDKKLKALALVVLSLLVLLPTVIFSAKHKEVQHFYSLKNLGLTKFIFILFFILPPYYLAEEFFFRGFLFLRLWTKIGWHSYWITEVLFTWAHLGKPLIEILLAFPVGLVLNYLTLKTKSIYPAMIVHFTMGALMNLIVTFSL